MGLSYNIKVTNYSTNLFYYVISFSFKRLNARMWKEHMNANVKTDTMIYLDQILFKAEFAQVSKNLLQSYYQILNIFFPGYIYIYIVEWFFVLILATTTECDLCNKNGQCVISQDAQVSCECRAWFAGRNCQINLKLLLIVGCVSVILMVVIAWSVQEDTTSTHSHLINESQIRRV